MPHECHICKLFVLIRFSAEKFHEILIEEQSSLASRDSASLSSIEERANFILRRAFDRLDRDFCELFC